MSIVIEEPLDHRSEKIHGPFSSSDFHPNYSLLSVYSGDVSICVEILWTFKKEQERFGPVTSLRCPPKFWRCEPFIMKAPWFYVRVVRSNLDNHDPNSDLFISIENMKKEVKKEEKKEEPKPLPSVVKIVEEEVISSEPAKRSSSPFSFREKKAGLFSKEKRRSITSSGPPQLMFDSRLPGFIPEGSILMGSKNGKIDCVPKPYSAGLILQSDSDGRFDWILPYPPRDYVEKKKEN